MKGPVNMTSDFRNLREKSLLLSRLEASMEEIGFM